MFGAFEENPKNCRFEGQDRDEKIILLLRAHPITNLKWIITSILLFLLPFFIPKIITTLELSLTNIPTGLLIGLVILNYLLILVIVLEGFLYWYFNVYILTDKRVIDFDFHSLLFKNVDFALLSQVQEASGSIAGFLSLVFHFGHVYVQTAGTNVSIDFENVPQPEKVADIIMDEAHKVTK